MRLFSRNFIKLTIKGEISPINTIRINRHVKDGATVYVGKNVKLTLSNDFRITGNGFLFIGHDVGNFPRSARSAFRTGENSCLNITSHFLILSGCQINIDKDGYLSFGSGYMNHFGRIICKNRITIGNNVIVAEESCLMDSDSHSIDGLINNAPIEIGDNCWIGFRSTILKGVSIGEGSIVASNALVTKSYDNNMLIGGNPGKVLRENVAWKP